MISSNRVQIALVLIIAPIVAFLCYLFGGPYTWSGYNYFYGNITTDRSVALKVILGLTSISGWILIYLTTKLLKTKIVLWQTLYYWITVALVASLLLLRQGISTIS